MPRYKCNVEGCEKDQYRSGLCKGHKDDFDQEQAATNKKKIDEIEYQRELAAIEADS